MKANPKIIPPRESAALCKALNDLFAVWQVTNAVALLWMRPERQDLTVNTKAPDSVRSAVAQGRRKRRNVGSAKQR
jgi:hypothetical protein